MTNPWVEPLAGMTLGGYELKEFIREGQFGLVFEARKVDTSAPFAMKILPPSSDAGAHLDFDNEGELLKKLNKCPSVINLVDTGVEAVTITLPGGMSAPIPFKYHVLSLAGGSLEDFVADPAVLSQLAWTERIRLWRSAIKGVHQMHLKLVAHRDLKSSNCLLVVSGSCSEVRVADLGRSKDMATPTVHQPQVYLAGLGDFRHAPPEHLWLQGGSTPSDFRYADLYGLGSLLAELTTGHPMTALAMTSWIEAQQLGIADYQAGIRRDLATLRPQFRAAIEALASEFPSAIRNNGVKLLTQLCDPVPNARAPQTAPGRRCLPDNGLHWLLNRADILARQMAVAPRRHRYRTLIAGRSA